MIGFETDKPEYHVLYCLTQEPKLIRSEDVEPRWFAYKPFELLVQYLRDIDGECDYITLREGLDAAHPNLLRRDEWDMILGADITTKAFGSWVQVLRHRYYRSQAQTAAQTYAQESSDENFQLLLKAAEDTLANQAVIDEPTLDDLAENMRDRIYNGIVERGVKTYSPIDSLFGGGIMPGRLWTIGARPSVGKSAFSINLIVRALKHQPDLTIDMFSLEMPSQQNYDRMLSAITHIDSQRLKNPMMSLKDPEIQKVEDTMKAIKAYDLRFWEREFKLQQIVKVIRQRAASAKSGYFAIVDYLGLITVTGQPDRRLQIEEVTRQLKLLTNDLNIPILLLSQLSRGVEQRMDKRPMLSDLRDSGSIEQDSNAVGFLYRDEGDNDPAAAQRVILSIQKNREGALGDIQFNFIASQTRFEVAYLG